VQRSIANKWIKPNSIFYFLGIILIFIIWHVASVIIDNEIILPTISQTFTALFDILSLEKTYTIILSTFGKLIIAVLISLVVSLTLVIFSTLSSKFENLIKPLMTLLKTIPVAAIIILLLIVVGNTNSPYIVTLLVILPIMYESILMGVKTIDQSIINALKIDSSLNLKVMLKIHLPLSFPYILTSIIQSLGLGLKVMVMAEFLAQPNNSIGKQILFYKEMLEIPYVFAWTLILISFILVVDFFLKKIKVHK